MPYVPNTFADGPQGNTPITAAKLNNLEAGVVADDGTNPLSAEGIADRANWDLTNAASVNGVYSRSHLDVTVSGSDADVALNAAIGTKVATATDIVIKPEQYGAIGDGVADETAAVIAAFNAASNLARVGLSSTILHPGATVVLKGKYNLASLSAAIPVTCDVRGSAAQLIAPVGYAGTVLLVGHPTSGSVLQNGHIALPDVLKVGATSLVAGSVGVRVQNLYNSQLSFGSTAYFETGIHLTGLGNGTVYNQIFIGWISYSMVALRLTPDTGGWVNQNTFLGGGVQQSPSFDGGGYRRAGWRHLVLDGLAINSVNGNTFVGVSFEGNVSEYQIAFQNANTNLFIGCRHEQGVTGSAVTVSGSTLTSTAHGLTVGNVVTFAATTNPGGMITPQPYFVVSVIDANTFTVSPTKAATATVFTSAGTSVVFFRPPTIYYDDTTGYVSLNVIKNPVVPLGVIEAVSVGGISAGNTIDLWGRSVLDVYANDDFPVMRVRNSSSSTRRPAFAAYPPTVSPVDHPNGWTTAISDRGLTFAESETESGNVFTSFGGVLRYKRPADTVTYDVPSATRSQTTLNITSLTCTAGTTVTTTVSLPNVSINDHVVVTPAGALPSGIVIAYARVTASGVVTIGFANITAADVILTISVQVIAFRRYY